MKVFRQSKGSKKKKQVPVAQTRKELRKEQRKQKKRARALYFEKKSQKFAASSNKDAELEKIPQPKKVEKPDPSVLRLKREKQREKQLKKRIEKQRKSQLLEANNQEDRVIKHLEAQLKLNKRKSKSLPKSFESDGLGYLLEFCDDEKRKLVVETEAQLLGENEETHFEKDFKLLKGEEIESEDDNDDEFQDEEEIEEEMDSKSEDIQETSQLQKSEDSESEPDDLELEPDDLESEPEDFNWSDQENAEETENKDDDDENTKEDETWEDIYGRKRDKHGRILSESSANPGTGGRFQRFDKTNGETDKTLMLRRKLKGLVNRLAEHNMHSIASQVDELYMTNSRNDMNEMLYKLFSEALVAPILTPERLIIEHMMLIAILHANVGTEVGAQFLLKVIKKFDDLLQDSPVVENKETDNLILMISHLYNFKVCGHQLIYQIIEKLLERFGEKEIELILLIFRSIGFVLRKDDPIALKEILVKVQQKASGRDSESSRVKFMLDVLLAIKNNNMTKIPQYDPSHAEHLKKIMKSIVRKGNVVTQLNISLEDLLQADVKGKWWIVGSAWAGNLPIGNSIKDTSSSTNKPMYSEKILELARKQRMNTDTRRNIFCILMTAEDCMDAFEKLDHLNLKNQQEFEIIHVIIDCCLQEKKFNPYYAVLAQKYCDYNRKYQMTIQYSLWDKLKTLDNYNDRQLSNLAKFLTHLMINKGISLSALKVIEFGQLDKKTMRLLRQIILGILLHENDEACMQVFQRVSLSPKLHMFQEGMRLFINHFLLKNCDTGIMSEDEIAKLKSRVSLVDKLLMSKGSRVIF